MQSRTFPGDELIKFPRKVLTRSILIHAPAQKVWPWIVQLGSGRGGWYSYDHIDNGGIPSANRIVPELQNIAVGDIMPAVPGSKDAFIVQQINPGNALVLVVPVQTASEEPNALFRMNGNLRVSWALCLEVIGEGETKLISRGRISDSWLAVGSADTKPAFFIERIYRWLSAMPWFILIPVASIGHSIMERRMVRGIKYRAEKYGREYSNAAG